MPVSKVSLRDTHAARTEEAGRPRLELDLGPDGGSFSGYVTAEEGPDAFTDFYRLTGLDPAEWPLDHGSLRVSMWQQSRRLENGDRDVVWLRSYRGNLRRLTRPEIDAEDVSALLSVARRHPRIRHRDPAAATRVVVATDLQIGKVDRAGGTPELLERVGGLLDLLGDRIASSPTSRALIADPGDLIEGFENTGSQAHTNDLSLPEMLRTARGVLTDLVSTVAAQHEITRVATCPSNHAAWRRGKSSLGRPGDDFGLDVHLSVRDVLSRDPRYAGVSWVLPEGPWDEVTYLEEAGRDIAITHGHRARSGKFGDWWKGQASSSAPAHRADLIISGHYHTFLVEALGLNTKGRERLHVQGPALDGGSAWWTNISGDESKPGLVTFVMTEDRISEMELITL